MGFQIGMEQQPLINAKAETIATTVLSIICISAA